MAGSITLAEELFARGDVAFLGEFRSNSDAGRSGTFAAKWYADTRPFARNSLLEYLTLPLSCYRHEAFVKRLFKLAEAANDDDVMGAFLVAFDRSIRRRRVQKRRYVSGQFTDQQEAQRTLNQWATDGYFATSISTYNNRIYTSAVKESDDVVIPSGTTLPRPRKHLDRDFKGHDWHPRPAKGQVLFTPQTRRYLRRRTWRYFRKLKTTQLVRYLTAVSRLLVLYTDDDVDSDLHLLDHWGLTHILFHHSPALISSPKGWRFAEGKTIADLEPAPFFEAAWAFHPDTLFDVLLGAKSRAVRQWAIKLLKRLHPDWIEQQSTEMFLKLADHNDPDLSAFGFDLLDNAPDLNSIPVESWLARLDGDDLEKLTRYSTLLMRRLDPARVSRDDAIRLASHRSRPVAQLGFTLLKVRTFQADDAPALASLTRAECEGFRPEIMSWLQVKFATLGDAREEWLIDWLDSPYSDVRNAGWNWFAATPLIDSPGMWAKLFESPYPDIRERLIENLKDRKYAADDVSVRRLWATVLCDVSRGGRRKPDVIRQVVQRIESKPQEATLYVPLLAICVRSSRLPEFRAGLAGLIGLGERNPELKSAIRQQFPELDW
jgi:hypothetical protein